MFFTPWLRSFSRRIRFSKRRLKRLSPQQHQKMLRGSVVVSQNVEGLEQRCLLTSPSFVSVTPNGGLFLAEGTTLTEMPRELLLQFSPGQALDTTTFGAIQIYGAGHDGSFHGASTVTDFNSSGAAVLRLGTARLGVAENGTVLKVNKSDLGGNGLPTIVGSAGAITLTLNSNVITPTTAQGLVAFAQTDANAKKLLTVELLSGPGGTSLAGIASGTNFTLTGADSADALSNLGAAAGFQMRFRANAAGLAGNLISLQFVRRDLGVASAAPLINVVGNRIEVTLNTNASKLTNATNLITALNANAQASALITPTVAFGAGATSLANTPDGTVLQLLGADQLLSPGYRDLDSGSTRNVVYRFAESLGNDSYRIQVVGAGAAGSNLTNVGGEIVNNGADTELTFSLDLGAQVTSVVPQPVVRDQVLTVLNAAQLTDGDALLVDPGTLTGMAGNLFAFEFEDTASGPAGVRGSNATINFTTADSATTIATRIVSAINAQTAAMGGVTASSVAGVVTIRGNAFDPRLTVSQKNATAMSQAAGGISQRGNLVNVYFNQDVLTNSQATDPRYYQLIDTKGTSSTADDTVRIPTGAIPVVYDSIHNTAVLDFGASLPTATYKLQLGTSQETDSTLATAVNLGNLFLNPIAGGHSYSTTAYLGDNGGGTNDVDLYRFSVLANDTVTVNVTPDTNTNTFLRLFDSTGTAVAAFTVAGGAGALDQLIGGLTPGTYYLGVSSVGNQIYNPTNPASASGGTTTGSYRLDLDVTTLAINNALPVTDNNSAYSMATNIGTLGAAGTSISSIIDNTSAIAVPSAPGSDDEPGHRNIPVEGHGQGNLGIPSIPGTISVINYHFPDIYGSVLGQPVHNQISEAQKDLTRFIFETFSRYTGTQYVETANSGIPISTGDVRAAKASLPVNSVAGISTVIINAIQNGNDNTYDGGWMGVAFHEIGHAVGLGHSSDLQSFMDGNGGGPNSETPAGDWDMEHLGHAYPKASTDIDLYKFNVTTAGHFTAEVTAKRTTINPDSSTLDAALTLFKDPNAVITSDFGTSLATQVKFTAANAGVFGNDVRLIIQMNDYAVAPTNNAGISVSGHTITVTLNTHTGKHTKASELLAALAANTQASLLVSSNPQFTFFSGADGDLTGITAANSTIALGGGNRQVVAANDDYYGYDPFVGIDLQPGTYYIGVSAKGNTAYDPTVSNTGYGGQSDGAYNLQLNLTTASASSITDTDNSTATALDGDSDKVAGGSFNFWFEAGNTIYVDKTSTTPVVQQDGTAAKPFSTILAGSVKAASRIVIPAAGPSAIADGEYFTINDGSNLPKVFEFDKNGVTVNNTISINIAGAVTVGDVVTAVTNAINAQTSGTFAVSVAAFDTVNGTIDLAIPSNIDGTLIGTLNVVGSNALLKSPNILRIVGNGGADRDVLTPSDATAYAIGVDNVGATLADGRNFDVPQGVTVMVDAGAVLKLQSASIDVGTASFGVNRQNGAVQLLGTSDKKVYLTSFRNDALGGDIDGVSTPAPGHWEGIVFRHDSDMNLAGTPGLGSEVYLNSVYQSDLSFGGGQDTNNNVYDPIDIRSQRPTVAFTTITRSAAHAMSATPDSFDDSNGRIGPDIHSNILTNNNVNGLFVRISTELNQPLEELHVNARFKSTDITYVLTENLQITGNAGGSILTNNIQQLTILGQPTSGSILVNGLPIQFDADATAIRLVLEQLYGAGNVKVTGGPLNQSIVTIEAIVGAGSAARAPLVINNTGLTGGAIVATTVQTGGNLFARPGGRLLVDPGVVVKLGTARIEAKRGSADLIAEGTDGNPVVFTSVNDDRYSGASGSFDLKSDGFGTVVTNTPVAGDWGGLMFNLNSHLSLDHAYIAYAGGQTPVEGGSGSFNAVELHEANARIANSTFEFNANGASNGGPDGKRSDREGNAAALIFVRGSQPVIVNNVFHQNSGSMINIDANALKAINIVDQGRATGSNDAFTQFTENQGPLVRLNRMQNDSDIGAILGMEVRGGPLDTQTVWDDTDIVHVLQGTITDDKFHTYGGIRLQSAPDESLVVKLLSSSAGLAGFDIGSSSSDLLEIVDRIGGTMQIVGTPGFPVILTSLRDDSVGASLDLSGFPQKDTNGDGNATTAAAGNWNEILFDKYSNDRNVVVVNELEKAFTAGTDINSIPSLSQFLGDLAPNDKSANENRRSGYEVHGTISEDAPSDVDVYKFTADAGTEIWLDIDRVNPALDTIVELVNASGNVLARSQDNSTPTSFSVTSKDMQKSPELGGDYYATTINDAGMRLSLPTGGTYFVRVRSNPGAGNLTDLKGGLTSGQYQLQIRLQQRDEQPGVAVSFADIRYATNGIHVKGLPYHSPLTSEASGTTTDSQGTGGSQPLGNLLASDRGSVGFGGNLASSNDLDYYQFTLDYQQIQKIGGVNAGAKNFPVTIDLDWADGFTRPDTTIALFDAQGTLIFIGRESNVLDDQFRSGQPNSDVADLNRGSGGARDGFIGSIELPATAGTYFLAVANNQRLPTALNAVFQTASTATAVRLEPVNSIQRIVEDHIGFQGYDSNGSPINPDGLVDQGKNGGQGAKDPTVPLINIANKFTLSSQVAPLTFQDLVLFATNSNNLTTIDPLNGNRATRISTDLGLGGPPTNTVQDMVMRSNGVLYGYERVDTNNNGSTINSTAGRLVTLDTGTGAITTVGLDNIPSGSPAVNNGPGSTNFENVTNTDDVDALTFRRNDTNNYDLFYSVRENGASATTTGAKTFNSKLYVAMPDSGSAVINNTTPGGLSTGRKGDIQLARTTPATATLTFTDAVPVSGSITFQTRAQGAQANGVRLIVQRTGGATKVVGASNGVVTVDVNFDFTNNAGTTSIQTVVDTINASTSAQQIMTAVTSGNAGTLVIQDMQSPLATGGTNDPTGKIQGNVTGLSMGGFSSTTTPGNTLYGVTSGEGVAGAGSQFISINQFSGVATIIRDFTSLGIGTTAANGFQGLHLGPQNAPIVVGTLVAPMAANVMSIASVQLNTVNALPAGSFDLLIGTELMRATRVTATSVSVVRNATVATSHAAGNSTSIPGYFKNTLFAVTLDGKMVALNADPTLDPTGKVGGGVIAFESGNQVQTISIVGDQATLAGNLTAGLVAGANTLTVVNGAVFTSPAPFDIQIGTERMTVTNVAGNVLTVTRGLDSTNRTVLSLAATSAVLTLNVQNGSFFTTTMPFTIRVDSELMRVTNVAGNNLTVVRGVDGTTAAAHGFGGTIYEISATTHVIGESVYQLSNGFTLSFDNGAQVSTSAPLSVFAPSSVSLNESHELDDVAYAGTYTLDFVNNLYHTTALAANILVSTAGTAGVAVTVQNGAAFPTTTMTGPFIIRIDGEEMLVTNHSAMSNTFTVTRGAHLLAGAPVPAHSGSITTGGVTAPATVYEVLTTSISGALAAAPATTLTTGIDAAQTSFDVASVAGFPTGDGDLATVEFQIRIDGEEMDVVDVVGSTLFVNRAANGTAATTHGARVVVTRIDAVLNVVDTTSFSVPSTIRVGKEDLRIVSLGGIPGTQFNVLRGYNGTSAAAHLTGNTVYRVETTAALNFNATAALVQTALENLPAIAVGDVFVFNGPTGVTPTLPAAAATPVTIQYLNNLARRDLVQLSGDTTNLVGDEIQRITLGNTYNGGTFTLTFNDGVTTRTTAAIVFNASATGVGSVQEALEALSNIGVGNVLVTGGALPGSPVDIRFIGSLQDRDFNQITINSTGLQNFEREQFNIQGGPTGGTFTLTVGAVTTGTIAFNATANGASPGPVFTSVQAAFDAAFGVGEVVVSGGTLPGGLIQIDFSGPTFNDVNIGGALGMTANLGGLSGGVPTFNLTTLVQGDANGATSTTREGSGVYVNVATTQDGILSVFDALTNLPNGAINGLTPDIQVTGGAFPGAPVNVTFTGAFAGQSKLKLLVDNNTMVNYDGVNIGVPVAGEAEAVVAITGTPGDGLPDNFIISNPSGLNNSKGLAFSSLDINLWHPTMLRNNDVGHGILTTVDNTRTPSKAPHNLTNGLDSKTQSEATGGASLYFGLEEYRGGAGSGNNNYFAYQGADGQLGALTSTWHQDLASNANIGANYNLPGGAFGKLTTNSFSLAGYTAADKPTFYFSYFLATEGTQAGNASKQMRDSARVFVSQDGGITWVLAATNNSALDSELPKFLDHEPTLNGSLVQELFDNSGSWRQARVDLSQFAGKPNLQFRFDFSTAGKIGETLKSAAPLPGEDVGQFSLEVRDSTGAVDDQDASAQRGQNNNFEGFYIDDLIVGFAERGEMVTMPDAGVAGNARGASGFDDLYANGRTSLNNLPVPRPSLITAGTYQLEVRRGTDYAAPASPTKPEYVIGQTFNTNDRMIAGQPVQQAPYVETFDVADEFNEAGIKHTLFLNGATPNPQPNPLLPNFFANGLSGSQANWSDSLVQFQSAPDSWASAPISSGQYSSTRLVNLATGTGQVSFSVMVDAAADPTPLPPPLPGSLTPLDANAFQFYIDGVQRPIVVAGTTLPFNQLPGTGTPTPAFVNLSFPVTAGTHTFEWVYVKGNVNVNGTTDAAYIDNLIIPKPNNLAGRLGDQNVPRPQGMVVLDNNFIHDVSQTGIIVEAANRDAGNNFSYPGSVRNTPVTANTARLVTSALLKNNVIANFGANGINFGGDPLTMNAGTNPSTAVPMGKIINNTIYGGAAPRSGTGILINNFSSPTVMNNIIANTVTGITIDVSSSSLMSPPDVTFNHFQDNISNGTTGTNSVLVAGNTSPLFLAPQTNNFYLAPSLNGNPNQAIDSSLDVRVARTLYTNVTGPLGIPQQDMFAPSADIYGQTRVADTSPTATFNQRPIGVGANAFKDRGAIERADFSGPAAALSIVPDDKTIVPDNAAGIDLNPALTSFSIDKPSLLTKFVISLVDPGTFPNTGVGVDDSLVGLFTGSAFVVTQVDVTNYAGLPTPGRVLVQNVDYTYAYNGNSNQAIFTALTVFPNEARYNITLDQTQILDTAGNPIQPNQPDGSTQFNILVTNGSNDRPVITLPITPPTMAENSFIVLSGATTIAITDADAFLNNGEIEVLMTASGGTFTLGTVAGLDFTFSDSKAGTPTSGSGAASMTAVTPGGAGAATIRFRGNLLELQAAMNQLRFVPGLDLNDNNGTGAPNDDISIDFALNDLGNYWVAANGTMDPRPNDPLLPHKLQFKVTPVNSTPTVTLPATPSTPEDFNLTFAGNVSVADPDSNESPNPMLTAIVKVTVSVTNNTGTFSLDAAGIASLSSFSVGDGTDDQTMTFRGTLAAINAALNGSIYKPKPDYFGSSILTVTIDDLGNAPGVTSKTATASTTITVGSQPDPDTYSVRQNSGAINANDPDGLLTLTTTSDDGVLANDIDPTQLGNYTATIVTGPSDHSAFTFNSNGTFTYTHDPLKTNITDTFTYTATHVPSATTSAAITVTINVNRAPVFTSGTTGPFSINENSPNTTIVGNGTDVDATDPDAGQTLTYAITAGDPTNAFVINPSTGVISVNDFTKLNFETTPIFNLTVTATDDAPINARETTTITPVTINLIDVGEQLTVTAADLLAATAPNVTLINIGGLLHVYKTGGVIDVVPAMAFATTTSVSITGQNGISNALTIDFGGTGGTPIGAGGVAFAGGSGLGSDSLVLTGGGTMASVVHNFTNASSGSVVIAGTQTVTYTGLEPISDNLTATSRTFNFSNGPDTVTLNDNASQVDGLSVLSSAGTSETVTFLNPTGSLTINAETTASNVADTVRLLGLDTANSSSLGVTVNGGGGNDVLIGTSTSNTFLMTGLNAGTLNGFTFQGFENLEGGTSTDTLSYAGLASQAIVNLATKTATFATSIKSIEVVVGGNGDDCLTGSSGNDTLFGGAGNDTLVDGIGNDILVGGADDDRYKLPLLLTPGATQALDNSGGGKDTVDFTGAAAGVTFDMDLATAQTVFGAGTPGVTVTLTGEFSGFVGTSHNDGVKAKLTTLGRTIDGAGQDAAGSDTFTAVSAAAALDWTINGPGAGSIASAGSLTLAFLGLENLVGSAAADTFGFAGGSVPGTINGASGANVLSYASHGTAATVNRLSSTTGTATGIGTGFSGIPSYVGNTVNATLKDTLVGTNSTTNWYITDNNTGNFTNAATAPVFTSFENLTGGTGSDNFLLSDMKGVTGTIDGKGSPGTDTLSYIAYTATQVNVVVGGASTNVGKVLDIETFIGGNLTADTLTGPTAVNFWKLTGPTSGEIRNTTETGALVASYSRFESFIGGTSDDTFKISSGVTIGGAIDGKGGKDTLNLSLLAAARTVQLTDDDGTGFTGTDAAITGGFKGINSIIATAATTDSLKGIDSKNATWEIDGSNRYIDQSSGQALEFSAFENFVVGVGTPPSNNKFLISGTQTATLQGGAGTDEFIFSDGAKLIGKVDGGAGSGTDTLSFAPASTAQTFTLTGLGASHGFSGKVESGNPLTKVITGDFTNIDTIIGGNGSDTLVGRDVAATWTLGAASSYAENGGGTLPFSSIENLTGGNNIDLFEISGNQNANLNGGAGADTFHFQNGASLNGTITGGADNDTVSFAGNTAPATIGNIVGSVNLNNFLDSIETVRGGNGIDTLIGLTSGSTFTISSTDSGTVTKAGTTTPITTFENFQNLTGSDGTDTFNLMGTGKLTGAIDGGLGTDLLSFAGLASSRKVTLTALGALDGFNGTEDTGDALLLGFKNINSITGSSTPAADDKLFGAIPDPANPLLRDLDAVWDINSSMSYSAGGRTLTFAAWETMTGGRGNDLFTITGIRSGNLRGGGGGLDTFRFMAGATLAGEIDGGEGNDTLSFVSYTTAINATLGENSSSGYGGGVALSSNSTNVLASFKNIDTLLGGSASDTLNGINDATVADNTAAWKIDGDNFYSSPGLTIDNVLYNVDGADYLNFRSFENLIGGDANDTFRILGLSQAVNLSGNGGNDQFILLGDSNVNGIINGGDDEDTFDLRGKTSGQTVNINSLINIENVIGNSAIDTLVGAPSASTNFVITGSNSGTAGSIGFTGFENLQGGTKDDSFEFQDGGKITGTINGGAGSDALRFTDMLSSQVITLTGLGTTDGFTGNAGATVANFTNIDSLFGSSSSSDSVRGRDADSTWTSSGTTINYASGRTINLSSFEVLLGGAGVDIFTLNDSTVTSANGGTGSDTLVTANVAGGAFTVSGANSGTLGSIAFASVENLRGGNGPDSFVFSNSSGTPSLSGTLDGGTGNDTLSFAGTSLAQAIVLTALGTSDGFKGTATSIPVNGFNNINILVGSTAASDSVKGLNAAATWTSSALSVTYKDNTSSRTINIASDVETLLGGTAIDTVTLSGATPIKTVDGGSGNDVINASAVTGNITLIGNAGNDLLTGGAGDDSLDGGIGDDTINGGISGKDTIRGGAGNDKLDGGAGGTTDGTAPSPALAVSDDIIHGGDGNDSILGQGGNDFLFGEAGNDTIDGGDGHDVIDTGSFNANNASFDTASHLNKVLGGNGNDAIRGSAGKDTLNGGEGNDCILGGAGADSILGGNGDDVLRGQDGNDIIAGEGDTDSLDGGLGTNSLSTGESSGDFSAIFSDNSFDLLIALIP